MLMSKQKKTDTPKEYISKTETKLIIAELLLLLPIIFFLFWLF